MKLNIKPQSRTNDILTQEVVGEVMIYDLIANQAYLLNPTSSLIWKLCDGTKPVSEIAEMVSEALDSPVPEEFGLARSRPIKQRKAVGR